MQLLNVGHSFDYETEKVIRIFLPFEKISIAIIEGFSYGDACLIEKQSS